MSCLFLFFFYFLLFFSFKNLQNKIFLFSLYRSFCWPGKGPLLSLSYFNKQTDHPEVSLSSTSARSLLVLPWLLVTDFRTIYNRFTLGKSF
jgi:hypothetical protein